MSVCPLLGNIWPTVATQKQENISCVGSAGPPHLGLEPVDHAEDPHGGAEPVLGPHVEVGAVQVEGAVRGLQDLVLREVSS